MDKPSRPIRVFLVEDEAILALSERRILERAGYALRVCATGESAVACVEAGDIPDLILMDIDLGEGLSGTEAAQAILALARVPIVFLTSHTSKEMVEKVKGITRYGYVIKNSGDFVLLSSIEMALFLFEKDRMIEERDRELKRAEAVARLGYWLVRPGTSEIRLSEGAKSIIGIGSETCSFEEFESLVCAEAQDRRGRAFRALVEQGSPYELSYRMRRADDGRVIDVHSVGRLEEGRAFGIIQDVTESKALAEALDLRERLSSITLKSIGDGVISTDRQGRVVEINAAAESMSGWLMNESLGRQITEIFDIVNAHSRLRVENPVEKVIRSGSCVGLANHTILIARDGREIHIADSASPIKDDEGSVLGMVLVFRDVTSDYAAEEALRGREEYYRALFSDAHSAMLIVDADTGSLVDANRAAADFYGWSREELLAMNVADLNTLPPERIRAEMRIAECGGRRLFRFVHRFSDGSSRPVEVASGLIVLGGRRRLLSIVAEAREGAESACASSYSSRT